MIALLQPFLPHYREEFFKKLKDGFDLELYCYNSIKELNNGDFKKGKIKSAKLVSISLNFFLLYTPLVFLQDKYKVLVLMLHFGHITTWVLLLTKSFHKKKIILWGHGISIKRFLKEENKPNILLKWMIKLSDGCWFYTENELNIWKRVFPNINAVSLNNTISGIDDILQKKLPDKKSLKSKYKIFQPIVLIYCARFNEIGRRIDLLEKLIKESDPEKFGFIIIGEGKLKPDFSKYSHVYDYGAVYESKIKDELFCIADIYFQPGWVGLSIVEAMAYGKPIFTFKRSQEVLQCVEYNYIENGFNGIIFEDFEQALKIIKTIDNNQILKMGKNSQSFVAEKLRMSAMVENAVSLLDS